MSKHCDHLGLPIASHHTQKSRPYPSPIPHQGSTIELALVVESGGKWVKPAGKMAPRAGEQENWPHSSQPVALGRADPIPHLVSIVELALVTGMQVSWP